MARALYSRKPVAIFDDVFSGLDKATERTVFSRVFGKNGLLHRNGTTVILATHGGTHLLARFRCLHVVLAHTHVVHHLPDSDFVIALDKDGTIIEQGSFSELRFKGSYVQSLDILPPESDDSSEQVTDGAQDQDGEPEKREEPEVKEQQQGRSSDRDTFKYYLASVTWLNLGPAALYIFVQGFFMTFRCESCESCIYLVYS